MAWPTFGHPTCQHVRSPQRFSELQVLSLYWVRVAQGNSGSDWELRAVRGREEHVLGALSLTAITYCPSVPSPSGLQGPPLCFHLCDRPSYMLTSMIDALGCV